MVSRIFFSKTKKFDWVIEKDITFIYYLIQGKSINLPFLMLSQIREVAKKYRACLPYGMVVTLIFIEFVVNCKGEDARKLQHTDTMRDPSPHGLPKGR